jgi:hypothetical protein
MAFGLWDIIKIGAPIAASAAGTPLAGAAVSAALSGGEGLATGKGLKSSLIDAGLSGATSFAGGKLGEAAGGALKGVDASSLAAKAEMIKEGAGKQVLKKATEQAADASKVARFSEHIQNFAPAISDEMEEARRRAREAARAQTSVNQAAIGSLPGGGVGGFQPWTPMHRR